MALSYVEYKNLKASIVTHGEALVERFEESGVAYTPEELASCTLKAVEEGGLSDRLADLASIKGFLGFMMMVNTYPEEFKSDTDMWVSIFRKELSLADILVKSGCIPEWFINSDPDMVMSRRFVEDPSAVIK